MFLSRHIKLVLVRMLSVGFVVTNTILELAVVSHGDGLCFLDLVHLAFSLTTRPGQVF